MRAGRLRRCAATPATAAAFTAKLGKPPRAVQQPAFTPYLKCRRHPYHCARVVCQVLHHQLQLLAATFSTITSAGPSPSPLLDKEALHALCSLLDGVPRSLAAEGPLDRDSLAALPAGRLPPALVEALRAALYDGALTAAPTPLMTALWPEALQQRYAAVLAARRRDEIALERGGGGRPKRWEAGRALREALADPDSTIPPLWASLIERHCAHQLDRTAVHELENLPQEIAISELLASNSNSNNATTTRATAPPLECVLDVGGGNGMLAAAAAERVGCDGVVVDPYYPPHSIDCLPWLWPLATERTRPAVPRRQQLRRTVALFKDTTWDTAVGADPQRTALIAKHLCGSAIDECLRHLEAQRRLPRVMVLAPCCFNKIAYETYCCPGHLEAALGAPHQAAADRVLALTDWNVTCHQHARDVERHSHRSRPEERIDTSSTALWQTPVRPRAKPGSLGALVPCSHAFSQLVEALVNHGRVEWLRERGYSVEVAAYVPSCVTPKNKCIIAVRE